jgi:hypothetical protein
MDEKLNKINSVLSYDNHSNHTNITNNSGENSINNNGRFGKFYLRMAAVPLILIFIRFWSSVRIILNLVNGDTDLDNGLAYMQAFFDPSQGFFNALIFVFTYKEEQICILEALSKGLLAVNCVYISKLVNNKAVLLSLASKRNSIDSNVDSYEHNKNNVETNDIVMEEDLRHFNDLKESLLIDDI